MKMKEKGMKIIASILIFMLTATHISILNQAIATSLEEQGTITNNANVEFDAYLMNVGNKAHIGIKRIGEENYLYAAVTVKNAGYVTSAKISIPDANFKFVTDTNNGEIENVTKLEESEASLIQIQNGKTIIATMPIEIKGGNTVKDDTFNKENKIKFTADYIDGEGKTNKIEKDIIVDLGWTADKEATLEAGLLKYIPTVINNEDVSILYMPVITGLKNNTLPIKERDIEISVPSINNKKPEEIKIAYDEKILAQEDYTYDEALSTLKINTKHEPDQDGNIKWDKNPKMHMIMLVYKTKIEEEVNFTLNAKTKLTLYDASQTYATKTKEQPINIKEQVGNFVEFNSQPVQDIIGKGQIYANYERTKKEETQYLENVTAHMFLTKALETNLVDKITFEPYSENLCTAENTKGSMQIDDNSYTYYKSLTISKDTFTNVLGEEGQIKLYGGNLQEVVTITFADFEENSDRKTIDLTSYDLEYVKVETTAPQAQGYINMTFEKAIKGNLGYTKAQMEKFNRLETQVLAKAIKGNNVVQEEILTSTFNFVEPETKIEFEMSNTNLSTIVKNENVKMNVILKSDTVDCNLYKNPVIYITLPKEIETIDVKNIEVLFNNEEAELTLKNSQIINNADGTKTIEVELQGEQTKYLLGAISKGINVIITADLTTNKLIASKTEQIQVACNNKMTNETKQTEENINLVAPTGVVTTAAISNYADGKGKVEILTKEDTAVNVDITAPEREIPFEMNVINNYNNTISNLAILGRLPFEGNKTVTTNKDMLSNITMPLISAVTTNVENAKIYYSENGNATYDLTIVENGWTLTPQSLENIKSYLIVLDELTMNQGDMVSFNYTAKLPANLDYNMSAYQNYAVYFNNNKPDGTVSEAEESAKLGVATGTGAKLEATLTSNVDENKVVPTDGFIQYTLKVTNTGTEDAENVIAKIDLPDCFKYIEFEDEENGIYTKDLNRKTVEYQVEELKIGQSIEGKFWIMVDNFTEEGEGKNKLEKTVELKAIINADRDIKTESNIVKNKISRTVFKIKGESTIEKDFVLGQDDEIKYEYRIELNTPGIEINNVVATIKIPDGLIYKDAKLRRVNIIDNGEGQNNLEYEDITDIFSYDETTKILTVNLGDRYDGTIEINAVVDKIPEGVYRNEIIAVMNVKANEIEEKSNSVINVIGKEKLAIRQVSSVNDGATISPNEKYQYIYEIENTGGKDSSLITFETTIPEELQYISTDIEIESNKPNGEKQTIKTTSYEKEGNKVVKTTTVEKGKKIRLIINVIAKELNETKTITSVGKIYSNNLDALTSNTITHIIEAAKYDDKQIIQNETKRITGQVWEDLNANGQRDEEETKIPNVEVILYDNAKANLVTDQAGNIIKTTTDANGIYTLSNVPKGRYTVIYLYDIAQYSATAYRKEGVNEAVNSDGIDTKITVGGQTRLAAITEEIVVSNNNIYNIDLGLISNPKFDLRLDKVVSTITVKDSNGTNTYDYNDTKLAKRELVGKMVDSTTIIVEYKLKVTNEGAVSGYAKKLVDYIPDGMKFSSELNPDWYTGTNGELYNSSLANTIINPGETKEVTLILSKKLTQDNLGLYHNEAEICESYNDAGLEDIDSVAGNNILDEDDISSADVLISIKTGAVIMYTGLAIAIVTIIGAGIYFIKKKVIE